jgi:predicted negative regulator of RcsB-dependent stress response
LYFLPHDINSLLDRVTPEERDRQLDDSIHDLAPRIAVKKNEYRHFGPYWWWVKPLIRRSPGARRSWFRGGYTDRAFMEELDPHVLDHPGFSTSVTGPSSLTTGTTAAPPAQRDRWLAWLGLQYYNAETVDDTPAGFHVVQTAHKRVIAYSVYDADASEQLHLFGDAGEADGALSDFLSDPARYTGSTWFHRAEEHAAAGRTHHAAAALRRAIQRAVDGSDRTRAWLRLGQIYQENDHVRKALFCYQNAFQRDQEGWIQGLMADAWLQDNEPQEALQCYQAALHSMPGNPEYQAGLERTRRILEEQGRISAGYQLRSDRLAR